MMFSSPYRSSMNCKAEKRQLFLIVFTLEPVRCCGDQAVLHHYAVLAELCTDFLDPLQYGGTVIGFGIDKMMVLAAHISFDVGIAFVFLLLTFMMLADSVDGAELPFFNSNDRVVCHGDSSFFP